ncbi:hypothetical protein HZA33_04690 [Candidatus Pacearchaeota archaeon]|nr:hypothetical protein [Candidatus Pacearchaeota archaeon]
MKKITRDILIVALIFLLGFLTAYYIYALQEWNFPAVTVTGDTIKVTPLFDKNYASVLISEINNADKEIDIAMFEFKFYENEKNKVRQVLDALINASARNVSVKILLDASDWSKEVTNENKATISYLQENGVNAKLDNPKRTLHAKLIIIDDKVFVGSHNLVFHALERNSEISAMIENSDVLQQYKSYFEWLWKG